MEDLTLDEEQLLQGAGGDLLHELETAAMTKVYKLHLLYSLPAAEAGQLTAGQLRESWETLFGAGKNGRDLSRASRTEFPVCDDARHFRQMRSMAIRCLIRPGHSFFSRKAFSRQLCGLTCMHCSATGRSGTIWEDILEYRKTDYYRRRCQDEVDAIRAARAQEALLQNAQPGA